MNMGKKHVDFMKTGIIEEHGFFGVESKEENKPVYTEPEEYIPEEIRKKYNLGDYSEDTDK